MPRGCLYCGLLEPELAADSVRDGISLDVRTRGPRIRAAVLLVACSWASATFTPRA